MASGDVVQLSTDFEKETSNSSPCCETGAGAAAIGTQMSRLRPNFQTLRTDCSLSLPLSFSPLSYFLSFSIQKWIFRVSHTLMASTISVLGEPERVNLVVRALNPDYLLLDIFLHLRSETWTQWTIEGARVKVHHRPYSFEDGPVVYPANAFDSRLRGD